MFLKTHRIQVFCFINLICLFWNSSGGWNVENYAPDVAVVVVHVIGIVDLDVDENDINCNFHPDRPIVSAWETWLESTFPARNIQRRALAISLGRKSNLIRKTRNDLWFRIWSRNWNENQTKTTCFLGEGREKERGGEEEAEGEGWEHLVGYFNWLTSQCCW